MEKGTKRTSFDLTERNSKILKDFSEAKNSNMSRVVNNLIHVTMDIDSETKKIMTKFLEKQLSECGEKYDNATAFEKQDIQRQMSQYQGLIYLFKDSKSIRAEEEKPVMKKIDLNEGYVLIPNKDDWIILDNFAQPNSKKYAGVVEVKAPQNQRYNHYVFFSDYKYGKDYPAGFEEEVYKACVEKDSNFQKVLDVQPIPGVERKVTKDSVIPGLFHIVEMNDPMYWNDFTPNYEPPYGAVIIRTN